MLLHNELSIPFRSNSLSIATSDWRKQSAEICSSELGALAHYVRPSYRSHSVGWSEVRRGCNAADEWPISGTASLVSKPWM